MKKTLFPLTKRQENLLSIIYSFTAGTGYPPTFEEMREGLGVRSNQSVADLLEKLSRGQLIKRHEGARSLTILPLGYEVLGKPPLVPVLGATSAGMPIEAIGISGQWATYPVHDDRIERLQEEMFMLRVYGDSMINAGIDDGDAVLVQTKKEFVSGEVVLAQIGDSVTIKRFISQDKPPYVYLKPENPNYSNILIRDDVELKGKIISVLKSGYWASIK